MKRDSALDTLEETTQLVLTKRPKPWTLPVAPRAPSDTLLDRLSLLRTYNWEKFEQESMVVSDLFVDARRNPAPYRVWGATLLDSDAFLNRGYLYTPCYPFMETPLLCCVKARQDDFMQVRAQCVAEMVACAWRNRTLQNLSIDIYGVVSNGQDWLFCKFAVQEAIILETDFYRMSNLPKLLGALDCVLARLSENVAAVW